MKIRIAAGLALILAACTEAPTGVPAAGPSLDSGYVIGSGNRTADSTAAAASSSEYESENAKETATNANGAVAGGPYVIGSGN